MWRPDTRSRPTRNHPEAEGVGPRPLNNVDGVRMSTNLTYLSMARHRLNLTIRANVLAHRVLFDGDRAIGIEVESGGDTFQVFGDEIILSGGAINSPHLLMLSGVGPVEHLESLGISVVRDIAGVGENLRDHPAAFMLYKSSVEDPPRGSPSIQAGMRYTTPGSPHRNDMQMSPILLTSEHRPATVAIPEGGDVHRIQRRAPESGVRRSDHAHIPPIRGLSPTWTTVT